MKLAKLHKSVTCLREPPVQWIVGTAVIALIGVVCIIVGLPRNTPTPVPKPEPKPETQEVITTMLKPELREIAAPEPEPRPQPKLPPGANHDRQVQEAEQFNSKKPDASPSQAVPVKAVSITNFPLTLDDMTKILGRPTSRNGDSMLYRSGRFNIMRVTKSDTGIDIAFNARSTDALLYTAGLFSSSLFTGSEQNAIIDMIDNVGQSKAIGRFTVKVTQATPAGWRRVSFTPKL